MPIRLGLVDDHNIVCDGIKSLIQQNKDFEIVFQTYSGEECLELLENADNTIDILLLDITMPKPDGFQILETIKGKYHYIKVIFLTAYEDYSFLVRALDLDVEGYLLKSISKEELFLAINKVNEGYVYIDNHLTFLLKKYVEDKTKTQSLLTKREKEIMFHVASGKMNKEIAFKLEIREETVKNHLTRIFRKFNVDDRTQAVVYVMKNNMIDL